MVIAEVKYSQGRVGRREKATDEEENVLEYQAKKKLQSHQTSLELEWS